MWKFFTIIDGAPYAMMSGTKTKRMWLVGSWGILDSRPSHIVLLLEWLRVSFFYIFFYDFVEQICDNFIFFKNYVMFNVFILSYRSFNSDVIILLLLL